MEPMNVPKCSCLVVQCKFGYLVRRRCVHNREEEVSFRVFPNQVLLARFLLHRSHQWTTC